MTFFSSLSGNVQCRLPSVMLSVVLAGYVHVYLFPSPVFFKIPRMDEHYSTFQWHATPRPTGYHLPRNMPGLCPRILPWYLPWNLAARPAAAMSTASLKPTAMSTASVAAISTAKHPSGTLFAFGIDPAVGPSRLALCSYPQGVEI